MKRRKVTMLEMNQDNEIRTKQHSFTLPAGLADRKQEKERLLVSSLKNLKVPVWFERSCKISEKKLHVNRFIYYLNKASLGQNASEKIMDLCIRLGMPASLLVSFQKILPDLSFVHFGFEERENTCGYKIYGEYGVDRKTIPKITDPFLIGLGFKWDALQPERQVTTRYTCVPGLSLASMHARIEDIFQTQENAMLIDVSKDILRQSLEKIPLNDVIYLEVADGNGPRRSFDINVYDAGLQMKHIHLPIKKIFQHFSIPDSVYGSIYNPKNEYLFGHISGGVDRDGKAFVSIYGGLEKQEYKNTANDIRRAGNGEGKV